MNGQPQSVPVITLGTLDKLTVRWDEMADERRYLRYRLTHCDRDWHPSRLLESEWLDGFNEAQVEDFAYSRLTPNHYINYTLSIPSADMAPTRSGNYLLEVYDEENPDDVLVRVPFYITENLADMAMTVSSRTDIDINDSHQQLSVAADLHRLDPGADLMSTLTLEVTQNGRQDNMAVTDRPLRLRGSTAIYEHDRRLIFNAGNEYRRFETVTPRYPGMGVERVSWIDPYYHFELYPDAPRAGEPYSYDSTQFGRFKVRNSDGYDTPGSSDTDADYVMVHFALDMPRRVDGEIYLDGDFTQRRFAPESRMNWNPATNRYEASILLKQGSYNYQYLLLPAGSTIASTAPVEGDKFETVNEYVVRLYFRPPGARADRLVGTASIISGQ
ncbi:MAG: DUF5103 domain-containing protein [Candidatus Amulumruptor caecigallinarius]|nr:DUF5103 domain-containing protein [Candidatus Amulumruptor caecigallinarius]MCM1395896.1 DUF5103 domain-containing protein [Candidatus Amulumruptor caecigallinarius]MCM1452931.1 DUF5103 domain-containing protein [bacterium]